MDADLKPDAKRKEVEALVDELFRDLIKLEWPIASVAHELVPELTGDEMFKAAGEPEALR